MDIEVMRPPTVWDTLMVESEVERCGVLLGRQGESNLLQVYRFGEVKNVHPEPSDHFRMERRHVARLVSRTRYAPLGYWHTHLEFHNVEPSDDDMEQMVRYPQYVGLVIHPATRTLSWFNNNKIIKTEVV